MDPDPRLSLVYDESRKSLDRQAERLDDLRGRAAALLTAGAVSAAFFGGATVGSGDLNGATWTGIAAFVGLGVVAAIVAFPQPGWTFTLSGQWIVENYIDGENLEPDGLRRRLTAKLSEYHKSNAERLKWLTRYVSFGCILLVVELCAFLVDLNGRG